MKRLSQLGMSRSLIDCLKLHRGHRLPWKRASETYWVCCWWKSRLVLQVQGGGFVFNHYNRSGMVDSITLKLGEGSNRLEDIFLEARAGLSSSAPAEPVEAKGVALAIEQLQEIAKTAEARTASQIKAVVGHLERL